MALTRADVEIMINQAFNVYDAKLGELMKKADTSVLNMQEQADEFNRKAEDLNTRLLTSQAQIQDVATRAESFQTASQGVITEITGMNNEMIALRDGLTRSHKTGLVELNRIEQKLKEDMAAM